MPRALVAFLILATTLAADDKKHDPKADLAALKVQAGR